LDNQILPVIRTIAISSNIFMEEMGVRNNPSIRGNFKVVVRGKPPTSGDFNKLIMIIIIAIRILDQ